jgi:hypothetical protein
MYEAHLVQNCFCFSRRISGFDDRPAYDNMACSRSDCLGGRYNPCLISVGRAFGTHTRRYDQEVLPKMAADLRSFSGGRYYAVAAR